MLKLADLQKEDDFYFFESITIFGKEFTDDTVEVYIEDEELNVADEFDGLSRYADWLNSEEALKKLAEQLEAEGLDCKEWYAEAELVFVSLTITGKGKYAAGVITADGFDIECEGKDISVEYDDMSME